jgi:hypothetical protein
MSDCNRCVFRDFDRDGCNNPFISEVEECDVDPECKLFISLKDIKLHYRNHGVKI